MRLARRRGAARDLAEALTLPAGYRRFFSGEVRHFRERITGRRDDAGDATIDLVFERAGDARPVIVKMDIEGFEVKALDGMPTLLAGVRGIILETHGPELHAAVIERLERAGLSVISDEHRFGPYRILLAERAGSR